MNEREIRGRPWQMQLLRRKSSHVKLNSILTQTSLSIQMASTVIFKQTLTDNCLLDTDTWPLESSQIPQVLNQMNPLSLLLPLNLLLLLSSLPLLVPISQAQSCPVFFGSSLSLVNHSQSVTEFSWSDLLHIYWYLFHDLHPHCYFLDQLNHLSLNHCSGLLTVDFPYSIAFFQRQ